jgi:hypothetical protein
MVGKSSITTLPTNFRISLEARVRAAAGIPAHMRRKRRIEDLEMTLQNALADVFEKALYQSGDEQQAQTAMVEYAKQMNLGLLNELIDRHNRYYPIEANLPMDVRTGRLMFLGKPWEPLPLRTWMDFV